MISIILPKKKKRIGYLNYYYFSPNFDCQELNNDNGACCGDGYISDCNGLSPENFNNLKKLKLLIIDCSTLKKHWSHFSFEEALKIIKKINPKKAILTNLSVWLDYNFLLNNVPKNVKPGYDGLKIRI